MTSRRRNNGRYLEEFVSRLEQRVAPDGFKVVSNQHVRVAGRATAEFDLVITGPSGRGEVKWLIECRDRPSAGAVGVPWIEQLIGRRERFRYDKVFAVSTTGFSQPARDLAREFSIVLRTVGQIADVAEDFKVQALRFERIAARPVTPVDVDTLDGIKRDLRLSGRCFRRAGESEFVDLTDLTISEVVPDPSRAPGIYVETVSLDLRGIEIQVPTGVTLATRLRALMEVTTEVIEARTLTARTYGEDGVELGSEGEFEWILDGERKRARAVITPGIAGTFDVRVYEPDGKPIFPPGRAFLFGRST